MATQKPIMYPNRELWEKVEQGLVGGEWKVIGEGDFDTFRFGLACPSTAAVVLQQRTSNQVMILQRQRHPVPFQQMMYDFMYRRQFKQQGWYIWCLRDVKDYNQPVMPTFRAKLWVKEGYEKFAPELDLDQDYQTPNATKVIAPTVLDAPSVRILNCNGQSLSMSNLTDNTFMIEGEGTFVGDVEVIITDPNRAIRSKVIPTEGLMRSYRTWKFPLKKIIPGNYKIQVKSADGKVQHAETVVFKANQSLYPAQSIEFKTQEMSLPDYDDGAYIIQTTATVSGQLEMQNLNSINSMTYTQKDFTLQASAEAKQWVANLNIKNVEGSLFENPKLTIGNQIIGNYIVELTVDPVYSLGERYFITFQGQVTKETQSIRQDNWQAKGMVTVEVTVIATKKDNTPELAGDIQQYFQQHSLAINSWWVRQIFKVLGSIAGEIAEHPSFAIWIVRAIKFAPK